MKKISLIVSAIIVAVMTISTGVTPSAHALNGKAYLGGGSGITFGSGSVSMTNTCTLTTIGYDNSNNLVGLAAGHCPYNVQAGGDATWANVTGQNDPDAGVVGTVVYKVYSDPGNPNTDWNNPANKDYSVIQFDKNKVVPLKTVGSTTINGIASGPPALNSTVCKEGRTSAQTCGTVTKTTTQIFDSPFYSTGGDSGGPVISTSDGKLYGVVHGGVTAYVGGFWGVPGTQSLTINPILNDINSRGGVGAGFTPTP
jgi:hypothetical protein